MSDNHEAYLRILKRYNLNPETYTYAQYQEILREAESLWPEIGVNSSARKSFEVINETKTEN